MKKSPLNYIGGKFKLLPQIIPYFPKEIHCFYDLFGGGFNVGANIDCEEIVYNDLNHHVKDLLEFFYEKNIDETLNELTNVIQFYQLNKTNNDGYLNLRKDFNENNNPFNKNIMFYALICYGFNYNIRFNKKGEFNVPFGKGKSYFSETLKEKLIEFILHIKEKKITFYSLSYEEILDILSQKLIENDFVYFDPPYLITEANYGSTSWNENEEKKLLKKLDQLNEKKIKFALSNVIIHKGQENVILKEWAKKYKIIYLDYHYNNTNPKAKLAKENKTQEVLIVNY